MKTKIDHAVDQINPVKFARHMGQGFTDLFCLPAPAKSWKQEGKGTGMGGNPVQPQPAGRFKDLAEVESLFRILCGTAHIRNSRNGRTLWIFESAGAVSWSRPR